jgi:hypothetical protein
MKKLCLLLLIFFFIAGCASKPVISDIYPFGPDTYKIKVFNNQGMEDKIAIEEAYKHCESLGKNFIPVQGVDMYLQYSLVFSCLGKDDPNFKRPGKGVEAAK